MKLTVAFIFCLASCLSIRGQDAFITVTNEKTNNPIEFAHIVFQDLNTNATQLNTTNVDGKALNIAQNLSAITISFVGYEPLHDTIEPRKSYKYKLKPGDHNLDEIVVTGQFAAISESNSVYKVKVINQDYIQSRGAISLPQVLNAQLNLRLQEDGVLGTAINIQGLGGENVKILIDGIPIIGRLNGNVDLSQININNVERIEIIEGPLSVLYGSNALAGTINIITKNPNQQKLKAATTGLYESVGLYNVNASLSVGNGKESILLDGGRNFFNGWSEVKDTRSKTWNQKEQYFGQGKYRHISKNLALGISFNGLWEQIKDRGDRLSQNQNNAFDQWFTTQRYISSLDFSFKAGVFKNTQILASYTYYQRLNADYLRDLVNVSQTKLGEDTTLIHSLMTRGSFATNSKSKWNWQIGYDFNYEQSRTERISKSLVYMGDYAVFASAHWTPSPRLSVQPGVRYSYNTVFSTPVVPSINIKYSIDEKTKIRIGYAHGFRAPTIKELYLDFVDQNHMIFGSESLVPENSKNFNMSLIWASNLKSNKQSLKVEPAVYYNYIQERIQLVKTGVSEREFTYQNISKYTTWGGKVNVGYDIHPDFSFNVGYGHLAYTNAWQQADEALPRYLFTPEYTASFNYWRSSKKFNFNVVCKYTGKTPDYRLGEDSELIQTVLPGFNWLDITATQKLWQNRIELTAGGKNLFGITSLNFTNGSNGGAHTGGASLISWGRTWFVRCKVNL